MKAIVNSLKKLRGSLTVSGAVSDDIESVMSRLFENDFILMPKEYIEFLKETDGFMWNGIEFFGTRTVDSGHHEMPDIIEANEEYEDTDDAFLSRLALGRQDDDIFVFNGLDSKYEVLDRADCAVMESFDSFEAMLTELTGAKG